MTPYMHRDFDLNFRIIPRYEYGGFDFLAVGRNYEGKLLAVQPVTISEHPDLTPIEPFIRLEHPSQIQNLMDELWRNGFRPSKAHANGDTIEAMKYHLEDMRRLVFKPEQKPEEKK